MNFHILMIFGLWIFNGAIESQAEIKGQITSDSKHYVWQNYQFSLTCSVENPSDAKYRIEWLLPKGLQWDETRFFEDIFVKGKWQQRLDLDATSPTSRLRVNEVNDDDAGEYICNIIDDSSNDSINITYNMWIVHKLSPYIDIAEPNNIYEINEKFNKTVELNVQYSGYTWPTLKWYTPLRKEIFNSQKFKIVNHNQLSTLEIYNTRLADTGTYTVEAINLRLKERRDFKVTIEDVPIVTLEDVYVHAAEKAHVQCKVQSLRKPIVKWIFEPCSIVPSWPSCSGELIQDFKETNSSTGNVPTEFIYDLYFVTNSPGKISCKVENNIGTTIAESLLLIYDISGNMTIYGISVDDDDVIAPDDRVTVTCAALGYYYAADINWYDMNGQVITETKDIALNAFSSPYSFQKSLTFKSIKNSDQGLYECRTRTLKDNTIERRVINIVTHEPQPPRMTNTNLRDASGIQRKLGESLELKCESKAIPKAKVQWYKDDKLITNNDSVLLISYLKPEDQGNYKCVVTNRLGSIEENVNLKITNIPKLSPGWIASICLILIFIISIALYLYLRAKRGRKLVEELKAAGLANFEEGDLEGLNPALNLNEQAELLPYNRRFEFPREKLKLGQQLGCGAFGVVLRAQAEGILNPGSDTTVAVKMVKRQASNEVIKALISELKIMVNLGKHLNVVNLLGAVTKNIAKRELLVIVEYCCYGNIRKFLLYNHKLFINQINPSTGKIDPSLMSSPISENLEFNKYINSAGYMKPSSVYENGYMKHSSVYEGGSKSNSGYLKPSSIYEGGSKPYDPDQVGMSTITGADTNNTHSSSETNSNEPMSLTTTDLVSWAFQISSGMEYLSSKNVLHGDLAARNILLCEENVVKICDFGLSRSLYNSDCYKKKADAMLPIRWLALESLSDHIFSTYTDVWSFGVVMWEIFSLAKIPYPEIDASQSVYSKLKDGYRMAKPLYANDDLYDIMLECWSANPESRPLFNALKERIAIILGQDISDHYLNLNDPYLKINEEYIQSNQKEDTLLDSPSETAPRPPQSVPVHTYSNVDGYTTMTPIAEAVTFPQTPVKVASKIVEKNYKEDQPPNTSAPSIPFPGITVPQQSPKLENNLNSPVNEIPVPEEVPMLRLHNTQYGKLKKI